MTLDPVVNTSWLAEHLNDPKLRIVDVRWGFLEEDGKGVAFDDRESYRAEHIPGAVSVGMASELADSLHETPDMILGPDEFARTMARLGISDYTHVVVYDDSGLPLAAARLWWALSYYGHENVQVLDGGLQQWKLEGREVHSGDVEATEGKFVAQAKESWIAMKSDVQNAIDDEDVCIVDCLPDELYRGRESHTWGGRSGHVPGAVNVPAISNIDPSLAMTSLEARAEKLKERGSFRMASRDTLLAHYASKGVTPDRSVITYCGRGIAASCGLLALRRLGFERSRLYDGSWAEWSQDESLPVESS
ncbi:3-mercaptopyruvate sulfurtransferase [Ruegeria denitrificans]|uniref:3-mercaptopyruvate sulfurtransferase n=1 Tax=Ruegeria denitrificans TaxID=1715692 RepID=A0A0P1IKX1_9RHOB|nr:sulfurtransferase [Ruegeria denitrificans]CUK20667.1 3-mercaptopyruvate sulfurtransferase [Ruegeria denitrificans]